MQPHRRLMLFLAVVVLFAASPVAATAAQPTIGPANYPALRWKFETRSQIVDAPVTAGNVLLQLSEDGYLYALDVATGAERWRSKTGPPASFEIAPPESRSPASSYVTTDGNTAFISDAYSRLRAIDVSTGETLWRRHTAPPQAENADYVPQFPPATVVEGVVYLDDIVDNKGIVYALKAKTGEELWEAKTAPMESYPLPVVDGVVFVSDANGDLWFIDAATGKRRARYRTGEFLTAAPVVGEGMAFLALNGGRIDAIQSDSGKRKWSTQLAAETKTDDLPNIDSIANGILFVSFSGQLLALDGSNGRILWKLKTSEYPTVGDGVVYVADTNNRLTALNATSGATLWRRPDMQGSRTVAGDSLYATVGSSLYALDATTGQERWRVQYAAPVYVSVTVTNDAIYLGSTDHFLYALTIQNKMPPPEGFASSPLGATSESLITVRFDPLPEAPAFAGIWRVTVPGNTSGTIPPLNGPGAGYFQSGSLAFPDGALKVDSQDNFTSVDSAEQGATILLQLKTPLAVKNSNNDAAELLVIAILPEDGLPVTGKHRGVIVDFVGGGRVEKLPGDVADVDLGRLRFDPGAALVPTLSPWPGLVVVTSGSLDLALENSPRGKVGKSEINASTTTTIAAGDDALLPTGSLWFARAGEDSTSLLLLAVSGDIRTGQGGGCGGRCIQGTR